MYYDEYQKTSQSIQQKRQAVEAFGATVALYRDHIEVLEKCKDKVFPHEMHALKNNFDKLQKRLLQYEEQQKQLTEQLKEEHVKSRNLDREMNSLKPGIQLVTAVVQYLTCCSNDLWHFDAEIIQLYKQRQQLQTWLIQHGKAQDEINRMLEQWCHDPHGHGHGDLGSSYGSRSGASSVGSATPTKAGTGPLAVLNAQQQQRSDKEDMTYMPHHDHVTWLMPGKTPLTPCLRLTLYTYEFALCSDVDRVKAESLLRGQPHGTFLIRRSRDGRYALSIVCNNVVGHCHIEETDRGFGFAEPYNIYPSLKDLVCHYAQNSLEEHNDQLKTRLAHPVGAVLAGGAGANALSTIQESLYVEPVVGSLGSISSSLGAGDSPSSGGGRHK